MSTSTPPPLTIGIDARAAAEVPAGRGRVVRELLRTLAARADDGHSHILYARRTWQDEALDERFRWRPIGARDPWWHLLAARAASRECDVFLSSNSYLTAWFLRIPTVPIVYDLVTFEPGMRPNRRSQLIERLTLGHAIRRSAGPGQRTSQLHTVSCRRDDRSTQPPSRSQRRSRYFRTVR